MFPVLIHFGFIKIYTFGLFLVLSFFAGAFVLWKNIKLTSYKEEEVFDGLFLSILGGLLGGRIVYTLLNFNDFGFKIMRFILINGYPGLSLFGVLLGSFITLLIYGRIKKIGILDMCEYVISPLLLALAVAKVGSFLSGNDIGMQTSFLLKARYSGVEGTRHIVAIYESILFFIAFLFAHRLLFRVRREHAKTGTSLLFFMTYFGLAEVLVDWLKQDRILIGKLSFNVIAGSIFFVVGAVSLMIMYRKELGARLRRRASSKSS